MCNIRKLNKMIHIDIQYEIIKSYCNNFTHLGLIGYHTIGKQAGIHISKKYNDNNKNILKKKRENM